MKKLVLCLTLFTILATGAVFADHPGGFGIGVQFGGGSYWGARGFHPHAALSLKLPSLPIFWAIRLDITNDYFGLGASGDYYFIDSKLVPAIGLNWYLGFGASLGLSFYNDWMGLGVAARLPIGLSWQPLRFLEIYLQIVPSLGLDIIPNVHFPSGGFGGDLGIRVWF
jgi:opacity protein-like surface antigen